MWPCVTNPTKVELARLTTTAISVVPDTGFGLESLLPRTTSTDFDRLRDELGLDEPYIVVQASLTSERFIRFVQSNADRFGAYRFLAVPAGPVLGDANHILADLPGVIMMPNWPSPLLLAELVRHAEALVGHSYHFAITGFVCGVPVFTPEELSTGKYSAFAGLDGISALITEPESAVDHFLGIGRREPLPSLPPILACSPPTGTGLLPLSLAVPRHLTSRSTASGRRCRAPSKWTRFGMPRLSARSRKPAPARQPPARRWKPTRPVKPRGSTRWRRRSGDKHT